MTKPPCPLLKAEPLTHSTSLQPNITKFHSSLGMGSLVSDICTEFELIAQCVGRRPSTQAALDATFM